jgi:ketosteroid isomerase-like protein
MTIRLLMLALVAVGCAGVFTRGGQKTPLEGVVDAENAFARMSLDKNVRESFMTYMAEDGVLFRPTATNARAWIRANPEWGLKGLLTWYPSVAGVSSAGDLGYTTGPWEFRPERKLETAPVAWGYFVSVWRLQPDGTWRNEVDLGTSNPQPASAVPPFDASHAPAAPARQGAVDVGAEKAAVAARDAELVKSGGRDYGRFVEEGARLHRENTMPAVGKVAAVALKEADGAVAYTPVGSGVAKSGDLGYVYGTYERPGPEKGNFLRIWRKGADATWRIVIDVHNPTGTK